MLSPGELLDRRFRIERTLGEGGMATVYLATGQQGQVAVKEYVLDEEYDLSKAEAQFRAEAEILFEASHPQLPAIYDFLANGNRFYLVMEFIHGDNMEEIVLKHGVLAEGWVLQMLAELVGALDYLHSHSPPIIYRDLKPGNVIVTPDGHTRLIDFGIAKIMDQAGQGTRTFARGAYTPGFAAPEQYGKGTEARTDIYSLGATVYYALTAKIPPASMMIMGGVEQVAPVRELRPGLNDITYYLVEWMMQLKLADRPASAKQIRETMQKYGVWLNEP